MSNEMIEIPRSFAISNMDEFNNANIQLAQFKDKLKEVAADEKSITAPINKSLKEIRDKYRPVKDRLDQAITIIRSAMNTYKRAEDAKRESDRLALEALSKDGATMTELIELVDEAPSLGGRLTTIVSASAGELTNEYSRDLVLRCWDKAMIEIRKDVAAGRVEAGVTVTKEKVL